jgi:signal transduction histidine kinase
MRSTWQQRPFQHFDLASSEETLGHVLVWLDEFGPRPAEETVEQVRALCTMWLARAEHVAQLEGQMETLAAALREQESGAADRVEDAKLAALAEMAAGAGHEINNPLAVISGRAQLLLAEENDPRRRKYLDTIMNQAQRIHRMIVDLMFFARPPAPECRPTDPDF